MDILKRGQQLVELGRDIVELLEQARQSFQDPQELLAKLLEYKNNPQGGGAIAVLVGQLGLDGAAIQQFLTDNESVLALLLGNVSDLSGHQVSWELKTSGAANANAVAIEISANAAARVDVDTDGDLFDDGIIEYDSAADAFLRYEIDGKVAATANVPSLPIAPLAGKAAFGANASLLFGNYVRHRRDEPALASVIHDVRSFALPYHPENLTDGQFVRVHSAGSIAVSGEVSWGKSFILSGEVAASAIDLAATPISAEVGLSASIGLSAETSGEFNIIVSREDGLTRVRLVKARTTRSGTSIKAGVGITITGVDKVASAVVAQITTPLNALKKILQENLDRFPNLHKLLNERVGNQLNGLLGRQATFDEIQEWLNRINVDVNLRDKLKETLTNAIDSATGALVNNLQANIDALTQAVKTLITRYQNALAKVNQAIEKAAKIKIAIELARKTQSFETRTTALDISIDAGVHQTEYRQMLHGDFTAALALARESAAGVQLNSATWSGSGGISIESSLSISAFGRLAGVGSLLKQNWDFEVSATGELTIGLQSELTTYSRSWRTLRSLTVLADTRLLAVLSSANKLLDPRVTDTVSIEASRLWKPTRTEFAEWEALVRALGVLNGPTAMTDDVVSSAGSKQPYGEITSSAVLNFTESDLRAIAAQPASAALLEFALQLEQYYLDVFPTPYNARDGQLPFLLWPSVRQWTRQVAGTPTFFSNLEFRSGNERVQVSRAQLPLVAFVGRLVNGFESIFARLQRLHQTPLAALTFEAALDNLRKEQLGLMKDIKSVLAATTLAREDLGFAFFVTLWKLAGPNVDPFVVIERSSDEQRFVYP